MLLSSRIALRAVGIFSCPLGGAGFNPGRHRNQFSLYLLLAVFLVSPLAAQDGPALSGRVIDSYARTPVAEASVSLAQTAYQTRTDEFGAFSFDYLPEGAHELQVVADGYLEDELQHITVRSGVPQTLTIELERRVVPVPGMTVRAARSEPPESGVIIVTRDQIEKDQAADIRELLDGVDGVSTEEAGPHGPIRVRIRGSAPEHILVLVDGQRLNSTSSGAADLSAIALEDIERIEIHRSGSSAKYGSGALGGAINIVTHKAVDSKPFRANTARIVGNNGREEFDLLLNDFSPADHIATRASFKREQTAGDFKYRYTVSPRQTMYVGRRFNASSKRDNFFFSGSYNLDPRQSLSFSLYGCDSRNGLPGPVSEPDSLAWRKDERIAGAIQSRFIPTNGMEFSADISYSRLRQVFWKAEDAVQTERFHTRYVNDIFSINLRNRLFVSENATLDFGTELNRDILDHDDFEFLTFSMGKTVRDNAAGFVSGRIEFSPGRNSPFDLISAAAALRYDYTETRKDSTSWQDPSRSAIHEQLSRKVSAALSREGNIRLAIRCGYGNSYRLPSINALFWKGDVRSRGNPGLRPEVSDHYEIGVEGGLDWWCDIAMGITYHHADIHDLIVWQQGYGGVWQPVNLAAARISGHDDFVTIDLFDDKITVSYQNSAIDARNRVPGHTSFNKWLTYRSDHTTTWSASVRYAFLQAGYRIRDVGKRYATESNTKWFDPYRLDSFHISAEENIFGLDWSLSCRETFRKYGDYVLIGRYPMPDREWQAGISVTYSPGATDEKGKR